MATEKKNWLDLHDDESDEEFQEIKHEQNNSATTRQSPVQKQELPPKEQSKPRDLRQERQRQREEQLKLFDQLENEEVWIFIFKNSNPDLEEAVKSQKVLKLFEGQKGWDLKMLREDARKLLKEGFGFRPKRVFAKIVVGKKNYPREGDRDRREDRGERGNRGDRDQNREHRKKYVQKQESLTNEYTFQKNRRNKKEEEEGQRDKDRKRQPANRYKSDPLYQGLGDFRSKQTSQRQQPEQYRQKEPQQKKTTVVTKNKYKEKGSIQEKKKSSEESPEVLTSAVQQQKQRKRAKKDVKPKKASNNPFDALD